jgi:hypothetical protein
VSRHMRAPAGWACNSPWQDCVGDCVSGCVPCTWSLRPRSSILGAETASTTMQASQDSGGKPTAHVHIKKGVRYMSTSSLNRTASLTTAPSLSPLLGWVRIALHRVKTFQMHVLEIQDPSEQTYYSLPGSLIRHSWKCVYTPIEDWYGYRYSVTHQLPFQKNPHPGSVIQHL